MPRRRLLYLQGHYDGAGEKHARRDEKKGRIGKGREKPSQGRPQRPAEVSADPEHTVVLGAAMPIGDVRDHGAGGRLEHAARERAHRGKEREYDERGPRDHGKSKAEEGHDPDELRGDEHEFAAAAVAQLSADDLADRAGQRRDEEHAPDRAHRHAARAVEVEAQERDDDREADRGEDPAEEEVKQPPVPLEERPPRENSVDPPKHGQA